MVSCECEVLGYSNSHLSCVLFLACSLCSKYALVHIDIIMPLYSPSNLLNQSVLEVVFQRITLLLPHVDQLVFKYMPHCPISHFQASSPFQVYYLKSLIIRFV